MISFRPVVEDGLSSRRAREEICFSNTLHLWIQACAVSSRLLWSQEAAAAGIAIPFSWLSSASGFAIGWLARAAILNITTVELRSALIALRNYPWSRTVGKTGPALLELRRHCITASEFRFKLYRPRSL
jgi:hypothetical protein